MSKGELSQGVELVLDANANSAEATVTIPDPRLEAMKRLVVRWGLADRFPEVKEAFAPYLEEMQHLVELPDC